MIISENKVRLVIRDLLFRLHEAAIESKISGVNTVYDVLVKNGLIKEGSTLLLIDGQKQTFTLKKGSKDVTLQGKVSTAAKGFGNQPDSAKTSTGLMRVSGFAGKGSVKGTVLIGLTPVEPRIVLGPNQDSPRAKQGHAAEVLTRAIVLDGVEEHNKNVKSRSIYVHGTNRESRLGTKASGGCIRVSSADVIALVDTLMKVGDYVYVYTGAPINESDQKITGKQRLRSLLEQDAVESDASEEVYMIDGQPGSEEEALQILSKYPVEKNA